MSEAIILQYPRAIFSMNKQASTFVRAFAELPPLEQAKVIDLIAEYYLANRGRRQSVLSSAASSDGGGAATASKVKPRPDEITG